MAQGSVHTFDPETGAGSVLLDDGIEVAFSAAAFEAGGLRLLRPGQRLSLDIDESGTITRVFIRGIGAGETIR
ncbi:MAG TPA: cold-shock protein [Intrasporangiaceae bacterium]|nr:cold-shock protein [Intrasporangiaceae bacterium]